MSRCWCAPAPKTLRSINPDGLPTPTTDNYVIVVTGAKLLFITGQEPQNAQGDFVGIGDLAAKTCQVFANLGRAPRRRRWPPRAGRQNHDLRPLSSARVPAR